MKMKIGVFAALASLLLMQPLAAVAQSAYAVLSVGNGSGLPGASGISVPVSLSSQNGAEVSAVNFDLNFDSARLAVSNVTTGAAASSAGKSASYSQPSSGRIRVIVAGMNQDAIPNGVVANVIFNVLPGAAPGNSSLSLSSAVASAPDASSIPVNTSNGSFNVLAPPATNTPTSTTTRTPTATSTSTSTSLPADTATATATTAGASPTPSRTPRPSNTPSSGATNTSAPAQTATSTNTASFTSEGTPGQTPSPTGTGSPPAQVSGTQSSASDEKSLTTDFVDSIAATGTAHAQIESAVAATGTALALADQDPNPAQPDENDGFIEWIRRQTGILLLGGFVLGAAILATVLLVRHQRGRAASDKDTDRTQPTQPVG